MAVAKPEEEILTLVRLPDGRLAPFVGGKRMVGWIDTTVQTNGQSQITQLVFHTSLVAFETQKNPNLGQLH